MIPFEKLESDDFDCFNLPEDEQRHLMGNVHGRLKRFKSESRRRKWQRRILKLCGLNQS